MVSKEEIKVGDWVRWSSQAGGVCAEKMGEVVAEVTPMTLPDLKQLKDRFGAKCANDGESVGRHGMSYVVLVSSSSSNGRPTLYWPRTSHLRREQERRTLERNETEGNIRDTPDPQAGSVERSF